MRISIVLCVLIAVAAGDVSHLASNNYLPPSYQRAASAPDVSYSAAPSYHVEAASAPTVSYAAPATQSYQVEAASAPAISYSAPAAQSYNVEAASAPAVSYSQPAADYESGSYAGAASEPAHTFSASEGYRYKTAKRRVIRRRRDVSHLSGEYLPPVAASAPVGQYESAPSYYQAASAPGVSYSAPGASYGTASYDVAASAPAGSYSEPAASYETGSYDVAASEPAHSYSSAEGYRYKTAKRRVIRRQRRDVSHLSGEYLPPVAASAPVGQYESAPSYYQAASVPAASYGTASYDVAASAPAGSYSEPAASYETGSYDVAASEPAHSYSSAEGYRYKTAKRRVIRRQRRDVSHLSSEYLPPHQGAASASVEYLPPVAASAPVAQYEAGPSYSAAASAQDFSYSAPAASAPSFSYSAPGASYETNSYETAASEPAHTFSSSDGYRYKTAKRRVIRRQRRDVSHLSSEYLPPGAASAPAAQYESAPSYYGAASAPAVSYSAPSASYGTASYDEAASAPAFSYSAPAASYGAASYGAASYDVAASEPAHSYSSAEGYRYKTSKRRVIRRHRF